MNDVIFFLSKAQVPAHPHWLHGILQRSSRKKSLPRACRGEQVHGIRYLGNAALQLHNRKYLAGIVLGVFFVLCLSCRNEPRVPNVDHLDGTFTMHRFEQDIFALDSNATVGEINALRDRYPLFWDLYFERLMPPHDDARTDSTYGVRMLVSDPRMRHLFDTLNIEIGDIAAVEDEFKRAFQYYQYYFPGNRVPNVYTLVSDFGYFPFIFKDSETDGLGISLEMFLGSQFPYAQYVGNHPAFSKYLVRTYDKDHIVKKTLEVLVDDIMGTPTGDRLLDRMIHNGKKLYILEHLIPHVQDSVLFEFTPEQVAWCADNERNLWTHYLTEDLIYSNDFSKINKLVEHSPNVPGLPREAPGRVANWSGWQIFHSLKRRNPELTLLDILAMRDPQEILEQARYRP